MPQVCDFGLTRIMQSEGLGSTVSSTGVTNPRCADAHICLCVCVWWGGEGAVGSFAL